MSSTFKHETMCLQNNVSRGKSVSNVIFNKFKHVSLYITVENHTSANVYGIANWVNQ